jgi:hypothetical protein
MRKTGFLSLALVVIVLALGFVPPAAACHGPPPMPPEVWIIFQSRTTVWIVFHNFATFKAGSGQFCGTGLNQVSGIESFQTAQLVDTSTNKVLDSFGFVPDDSVGKSFDGFKPVIGTVKLTRDGRVVASSPQPPFSGFKAAINQDVKAGITVDLWICVTVRQGTTFGQLAQALTSQGMVAASEVRSDGSLVEGHTNMIRPASSSRGARTWRRRPSPSSSPTWRTSSRSPGKVPCRGRGRVLPPLSPYSLSTMRIAKRGGRGL